MNLPNGEAIPPQNEVSGGPQLPLEIGKTGWQNTLKRTGKKFSLDRCTTTAGSLAYQWFLALYPALIAVLGLVALAHIGTSQVHRLHAGHRDPWRIASVLIVFGAPLGTAIGNHVSLSGSAFVLAWTVVRWVLTLAAITLLFSFYYYFAPNRASPRWQWVSAGGIAGTAIQGWRSCSAASSTRRRSARQPPRLVTQAPGPAWRGCIRAADAAARPGGLL
jgi:hypothetical protein